MTKAQVEMYSKQVRGTCIQMSRRIVGTFEQPSLQLSAQQMMRIMHLLADVEEIINE